MSSVEKLGQLLDQVKYQKQLSEARTEGGAARFKVGDRVRNPMFMLATVDEVRPNGKVVVRWGNDSRSTLAADSLELDAAGAEQSRPSRDEVQAMELVLKDAGLLPSQPGLAAGEDAKKLEAAIAKEQIDFVTEYGLFPIEKYLTVGHAVGQIMQVAASTGMQAEWVDENDHRHCGKPNVPDGVYEKALIKIIAIAGVGLELQRQRTK